MKIKDIDNYGLLAQGKNELLKFLGGDSITRKEAMLAKCYECMNGYIDGKNDCCIKTCPLYSKMPYATNKSHKKREMSDEDKKKLVERLSKGRAISESSDTPKNVE